MGPKELYISLLYYQFVANLDGKGFSVLTMPGHICRKVKDWVPFQVQVNEMNKKLSFKLGVKVAVPLF